MSDWPWNKKQAHAITPDNTVPVVTGLDLGTKDSRTMVSLTLPLLREIVFQAFMEGAATSGLTPASGRTYADSITEQILYGIWKRK